MQVGLNEHQQMLAGDYQEIGGCLVNAERVF